MADIPTFPYLEDGNEDLFLHYWRNQLAPATYFSETTVPTYAVVLSAITQAAAKFNGALSRFGFALPLTEHPDEVWDEWQTYEIKRMIATGATASLMDHLHPLPRTPGSVTAPESRTSRWEEELKGVAETGGGLRANWRNNTKAGKAMQEPRSPETDTLINHYVRGADPLEGLQEYTSRRERDRGHYWYQHRSDAYSGDDVEIVEGD